MKKHLIYKVDQSHLVFGKILMVTQEIQWEDII